jgi:LAO/AO transport system kinase
VNKADANPAAARLAKRDYLSALKLMHGATGDARRGGVPVLLMSGLSGQGIDVLWQHITEHLEHAKQTGQLDVKRLEQLRRWMWSMVEQRVLQALHSHPKVSRLAAQLEADVLSGKLTPTLGAQALLRAFGIDD